MSNTRTRAASTIMKIIAVEAIFKVCTKRRRENSSRSGAECVYTKRKQSYDAQSQERNSCVEKIEPTVRTYTIPSAHPAAAR